MIQIHPIKPFYDKNSKILILGSFPSVKTRETNFLGILKTGSGSCVSAVFDCETPIGTEEKKGFLLSNNIALWDVLASCDIEGSADSSIKETKPNDISAILGACDIKRIFVNGKTAEKYYIKYIEPKTGKKAICLPSTSPANASWPLEKLIAAWRIIREDM